MKIIINESQLRLIIENEEKNLLDFTPFMYADSDKWDNMFTHINKKKGGIYTGYYISGNLYLDSSKIKSLGNLESVGGNLNLYNTQIESLGNLESVGGDLYLRDTPLSDATTEEELRSKINVEGEILL